MKNITRIVLIVMIIIIIISLIGLVSYYKFFKNEEVIQETNPIVGKYKYSQDGYYQELLFNEDGTYWLYAKKSSDGASYGEYTFENNMITLNEKYSFGNNSCLNSEFLSVFLYSFEDGKIITDDSYVGMTETQSVTLEKTTENLNNIENYTDLFNSNLCKTN